MVYIPMHTDRQIDRQTDAWIDGRAMLRQYFLTLLCAILGLLLHIYILLLTSTTRNYSAHSRTASSANLYLPYFQYPILNSHSYPFKSVVVSFRSKNFRLFNLVVVIQSWPISCLPNQVHMWRWNVYGIGKKEKEKEKTLLNFEDSNN